MEDAVVADLRLPADHDVRIDDGARADRAPSPTTANGPTDASGAELHAVAEHRESDARLAAGRQRIREELDRLGEREIRLRVAQHRARRRLGAVGPRMTAEARVARSSAAYLGLVKNVRSPGPASSMPDDAMDLELAVAFEAAPETLCDLVEFQPSQYTTTVRTGRRVGSLS